MRRERLYPSTTGTVRRGAAGVGGAVSVPGEWFTEQWRACRPARPPPLSALRHYEGSVQPVPGSVTLATLSMGTLLIPPATSRTSRM